MSKWHSSSHSNDEDALNGDSIDFSLVIDLANACLADADEIGESPVNILYSHEEDMSDGLFTNCGMLLDSIRFSSN